MFLRVVLPDTHPPAIALGVQPGRCRILPLGVPYHMSGISLRITSFHIMLLDKRVELC